MVRFFTWFSVFLVINTLYACAGLSVETLGKDAERDKAARGFRYYQPAPYLFVHSDGKGGIVSEIKFLPDISQKMSAKPYAYFATNESTLQFDAGMLTQAAAIVDETIVPGATVDALAKVLGAVVKTAFNAPGETNIATVPVPYLFKIVVKDNTIELRGGPEKGAAVDKNGQKMVIRVTIAEQGGN